MILINEAGYVLIDHGNGKQCDLFSVLVNHTCLKLLERKEHTFNTCFGHTEDILEIL